jgi:hypothetical protein
VSDVAKDHALRTKFFFFPAPSPPCAVPALDRSSSSD